MTKVYNLSEGKPRLFFFLDSNKCKCTSKRLQRVNKWSDTPPIYIRDAAEGVTGYLIIMIKVHHSLLHPHTPDGMALLFYTFDSCGLAGWRCSCSCWLSSHRKSLRLIRERVICRLHNSRRKCTVNYAHKSGTLASVHCIVVFGILDLLCF